MRKLFVEISEGADQILADYSALIKNLDLSKTGDEWIAKNAVTFSKQLKRLSKVAEKTDLLSSFESRATPHSFDTKKILDATGWHDHSAQIAIQEWRRDPEGHPYENIPEDLRKGIFDYFFQNDFHGELADPSTIFLSRGVNDPEFFRPPTIVNVAIDVANQNNWFGYSHSLGHVDTREAIANLERTRRNQDRITVNNTAVVQGGTAGLNAVLSMLCRREDLRGCLVAAPTYAPILDDISHYFEPHILELSDDYQTDFDKMTQMIEGGDISAVIISIPHNPYGFRDFGNHWDQLHNVCLKHDVTLICDEIIFDKENSNILNPIDYPNLIVISSYSKTYNIPGLKLGHILARQDFLDDFYSHANTIYGSTPSFLYLTATCIAKMEQYARSGGDPNLPQSIIDQFSDKNFITKDFDLWQRFSNLHHKFQRLVASTCNSKLGHVGVDKVFGLDDPSYNIVIRMRGNGSAYRASLSLLAATNVSTMPIECFSPMHKWPRDLRTTITVEPEKLILGYPQLLSGIDDIVAKETRAQWMHEDDVPWLDTLGLDGHVKGISSWGRAKRIQTRLNEIFNLAGKTSAPDYLKRVATLMSLKHTWSLMSSEQKNNFVAKLTGRNNYAPHEQPSDLIEYFLSRPGHLTTLQPLPEDIKSLLIEWVQNSANTQQTKELQILSTAENLQGISLAGKNIEEVQNTLAVLGVDDDFTILNQAVAQAKSFSIG